MIPPHIEIVLIILLFQAYSILKTRCNILVKCRALMAAGRVQLYHG